MQDENPAASTAQDIKAAARDMLRLGSRWAHSALDWIDDRSNAMSHRNDRDFDRNFGRSRTTPFQDPDDIAREERDRARMHGRRGESRSDRDIQSDFSGGGYDQVRSQRGSEDWYRRGGSHDSQAQRGRFPDDDGDRGDYSVRGYSGAGYGQGASGPGGVGYGAPGYGAGQGYGAGPQYGYEGGSLRDESRGFGGYDYTRGFESDIGGGDYDAFSRQGHHGLEGYGQPRRGTGGQREYRARGSAGQGYGAQGYSARNQGDYRAQGYGFGSQPGLQGSQTGSTRPSYRGLGPRNYTRSDERIREDLNERLTDAHDIDASGISVEVSNGVATLTGTVHERWMKHRAEDLADGCSGVRDVRNQIQVQPAGSQSQDYPSQGYGQGSQQAGMAQGRQGSGSSASGSGGSMHAGSGSTTGTGTQAAAGGSRGTSSTTTGAGGASSTSQYGTPGSGSQGSAGAGGTGHNA